MDPEILDQEPGEEVPKRPLNYLWVGRLALIEAALFLFIFFRGLRFIKENARSDQL